MTKWDSPADRLAPEIRALAEQRELKRIYKKLWKVDPEFVGSVLREAQKEALEEGK